MIIKFTLTMPNRNSWNNHWSREANENSICKTFRKKSDIEFAKTIDGKDFYHNFGDGWTACISCKIVSSKEAARSRKRSIGFSGYDWMIDSLIKGKYDECQMKFYH